MVRKLAETSIMTKALFIVAVPLVMLSLLMVDDFRQALEDKASMQTMLQAAELVGDAATLVHELQKERGLSAGLLGSQGKLFSDKLVVQRRAVNLTLSGFKTLVGKNTPLLDALPKLHQTITHLIVDMAQLGKTRQNVDKLSISVEGEIAYYSNIIDELMDLSNFIRNIYTFGKYPEQTQTGNRLIVPNARFSGLLSSYILLAKGKEAAGLERAILSNTFGMDHFGSDMYERFVSLVARQRNMFDAVLLQSPEAIIRIFSSHYTASATTEVEQFRAIAIYRAKTGGFGVEPEQWFSVASKRIALLQQVEDGMIELIMQYSRQGVDQSGNHIRDMLIRWIIAILLAGGLSLWAAWHLLQGIRRANNTLQSIEAGEYDVPVIVQGGDEMARLLGNVEQMRCSLVVAEHERAQQEQKAHARLESLLRMKDEVYSKNDFIERLLSAMPSILIAVDSKKNITLWNDVAEQTFGLSHNTVVGDAFSTLDIEWDREEINRTMIESEALYACRLEHVKFRRTDGSDGFLGLTISAVVEDGQNNGFLLIGSDITEKIQIEHQLQLSQRMESMGELAAGIAHEINTPMQYIGDNVRFLKDGFVDMLQLIACYHQCLQSIGIPEHHVRAVKQAETKADIDFLREEIPAAVTQTLEGVAHVSKIVGAMKALSHPGTGDKMPIDINKVIENTVTVSRNEWKYVAELTMKLDPELPIIQALPEISQVFLNIIVNAAHAIADVVDEADDAKGEIYITSTCVDQIVEIRIRDSGSGMDKVTQGKIFDPFFTTKEPGKGTGQGLAISHQIVCNRLGGWLWVKSESGHGATFVIQLPVGEN